MSRFLLDSDSGVKLHVSDVTEAPAAAARDVDDAAPLVAAEGRAGGGGIGGRNPKAPDTSISGPLPVPY